MPRLTKKFKDEVQPRNIPSIVIEDIIANGTSNPGKDVDTIEHIINKVMVITNTKGDVLSVHRI